ncbi:hypothetical protein FRC19_003193 [Serendipita sp. 401]|nr:hypothetical protein FRC19_003193 [Serendipita sp. 401]
MSQHEQKYPVDQSGYRPSLRHVQCILQSYSPEQGSGLIDVRRHQPYIGGHEKQSSSQGSGPQDLDPIEVNNQSVDFNGSRGVRSEGSYRSGDNNQPAERSDVAPIPPNSEEPLRIGSLSYLHVHTGDERFRWIRCNTILFRSQLQLTWVEAGSGRAIIGLDLLNRREARLVPSPSHTSL